MIEHVDTFEGIVVRLPRSGVLIRIVSTFDV